MPDVNRNQTIEINDSLNTQDIPVWNVEINTGGGYSSYGEYLPTRTPADSEVEGSTDTYTFEFEFTIPSDAAVGGTYQFRFTPAGYDSGEYLTSIFESDVYTVVESSSPSSMNSSLMMGLGFGF